MKSKRGQAALEFLTTYGWAFLIILIMIGALAYFGVLNPKSMLPGRCTFGPEIDCVEYQVVNTNNTGTDDYLLFRFRNNVGSTADFNFTAVYLGGTNPEVVCDGISASYNAIQPGRINEVRCDFTTTFPVGDKVKFEVTAEFKKTDGVYTTPVKGEVYGEVIEG